MQSPAFNLKATLIRRAGPYLPWHKFPRQHQKLQAVDLGHRNCQLSTFSAQAVKGSSRSREILSRHQPLQDQAQRISKEDQRYWEEILEGVHKPSASQLIDRLDLAYPLGVKPPLGGRAKKPLLYEYFLQIKRTHSRKVLLVRIGEFYETIGIDAVLLVQFCGLNPMGQREVPHAGCPAGNIRRTLQDLVEQAGLSVVVCEEVAEPYRYGTQRTSQKRRYVAGIITPAQPTYLHGLVDEKGDAAQVLEAAPPVLGVAASVGGFKIIELNVDLRQYVVIEGLTEDAVSARLHQGGLAPPLYVHRSEHERGSRQLTEASIEDEWALRISQFFKRQAGTVKTYTASDPVQGLLDIIKRDLEIPADATFTLANPDPRIRPKAVFHSTASQLGIHQTRGVPSLLEAIIPSSTPLIQRRYMRRLLLMPPPTEVAASIRRACQLLAELRVPLPSWTVLDSNQVVRMIYARETNEVFFRDLKAVVLAIHSVMQQSELQPLAHVILQPVILESGINFYLDKLAGSCRSIMQIIDEVVEEAADEFASADAERTWDAEESQEGLEVLQRFFRENEDFRGKVKRALVHTEADSVELTGEKVEQALKQAFLPLKEVGASDQLLKARPRVVYDPVNNAVWVKVPRGSKSYTRAMELSLIQPADRNGRLSKDVLSSERLEEALNEYRAACDKARTAVRNQLQNLADRLQAYIPDLVGTITFAVIASALEAHVREATQRRWAPPVQLPPAALAASSQDPSTTPTQPLHVEGMWPYWLDARSQKTTPNTFELDSMVILTGPNMAGKSTIMRSLCAVAVLSACGLYAPVAAAVVPYIDSFMLRAFSADSPLEGKSSFAIEMNEMKHVMRDVSKDSLILVDELGKGTEPRAGAAIAATFVEFLDAKRCRGIFATHLHELLDMEDLRFQNVQYMCMETKDAEDADPESSTAMSNEPGSFRDIARRLGGKVPTWRMIPGTCRHSLALIVAEQCGVPMDIVHRAGELYQNLMMGLDKQTPPEALAPQPERQSWGRSRLSPSCDTSADSAVAARTRQIEEAAGVLAETADHVFAQLSGDLNGSAPSTEADLNGAGDGVQTHGTEQSLHSLNGHSLPETQVVRAGQAPPPSTIGYSCAYIVRRPDGWFYCGETDDIKGRLATHRRRTGRVKGGSGMEAAYLVIPSSLQGKSAARELESRVIKAMQEAGFPMLSVADSRQKRTPRTSTQAAC